MSYSYLMHRYKPYHIYYTFCGVKAPDNALTTRDKGVTCGRCLFLMEMLDLEEQL